MVVELKRLNTREPHEEKQLNLNKQHACIYIIDNFKNIDLYKKSNSVFKKSSKLNYLSSHVLRSLYLIKLSPIHHTSEKKIFSRGSIIPRAYSGFEVVIHRGNKFRVKQVNNWSVGFRFGEFTWNRKVALYKAKQKKKKK